MKTIIVVLLILIIPAIGQSQETRETKKKVSSRKQLKMLTKQQINQLHEGALLVRLQTKKNSIAALRKIEKDKLADKIETKQMELNKSIVSAFREDFDFCPTYFFFSDYSKNVMEKQFDHVEFLNGSLLPDTTIKFDNKYFLTAEFGTIDHDTANYFYHESDEPDGNKKVSDHYTGPTMGFGALVINSDQFIQLSRPFPYYVRTFDSLPNRHQPNRVVKEMNIKLHNFYKKRNH